MVRNRKPLLLQGLSFQYTYIFIVSSPVASIPLMVKYWMFVGISVSSVPPSYSVSMCVLPFGSVVSFLTLIVVVMKSSFIKS